MLDAHIERAARPQPHATAPDRPVRGSARRQVRLRSAPVPALVIVVTFLLVGAARPQPVAPVITPWIDTGDRVAVEAAYGAEFAAVTPDLAWTGSHDECRAGDSSDEARQATIERLNFYRAMAGVEADVVLDHDFSEKAQHAALMMSAEGRLSHSPGEDYACFDHTGQEAAANSNLYLGRTGVEAVDGYIEDPGERNRDVGHRLTILHPPTTRMGVGHVEGTDLRYPANALWVFDDQVFVHDAPTREESGFVAWPPRGYVPERLVYPRWSFALDGADLSEATVTMTADGEVVDLEVIERTSVQGQVPSSVLVWEPRGLVGRVGLVTPAQDSPAPVLSGDLTVEVTVAGVRPAPGGPAVDQHYVVVIMADRSHPELDRVLSVAARTAPWPAATIDDLVRTAVS